MPQPAPLPRAPPPTNTHPPPPLPPSVESSYRQKCISLKRRMNEVSESNDAFRLRKVRLERGITKLRLERAFMLEQLAKRTSENVEDSEGSPSPPPTPKEKPLRIKRGHRRPTDTDALPPLPSTASLAIDASSPQGANTSLADALAGDDDLAPPSSPPAASSPPPPPPTKKASAGKGSKAGASSKTAAGAATAASGGGGKKRGGASPLRRPTNAYMIFCTALHDEVLAEHEDEEGFEVAAALARRWRDLGSEGQEKWFEIYEVRKREWEEAVGRRRRERRSAGGKGGQDEEEVEEEGGAEDGEAGEGEREGDEGEGGEDVEMGDAEEGDGEAEE